MKQRWQIALGILVSIFFLWLTVPKLGLGTVAVYLRQAHYWWIVPGVVVYFGAVWARTWRWHYLLRSVKSISLRELFPVVCIGYFGNNVYPARAGELIRAFVLRRNNNVPIGASLATIIIERVFDGLVMLLFVVFALPFVGANNIPSVYRSAIVTFAVIFLAALAIFFWMAVDQRHVPAVYSFLADHFLPGRFRGSVDAFYERFILGLHSLRSGRDVTMVFATSAVIWLTETVKYWFVLHAFGLQHQVSFVGLMLMNGIVNLATTLPSAPGYLGTFEVGASVLAALGVGYSLAFGYTIVLHAALWFPITVLGAWYMWREGVRWRDFRSAEGTVVEKEMLSERIG